MLNYIPFPLKMEWLFFLVYTFVPMILGSISSKIIKENQHKRIAKKLAELDKKNS